MGRKWISRRGLKVWSSGNGLHKTCEENEFLFVGLTVDVLSFITWNPIAWHPQYQTVMPLLSIMIYHELSQSTLICDGLWVYFYHDLSYQFKTAFSSCHLPSSSCGLVSDLRVFLDWVRAWSPIFTPNSHIFPVPATQHLVGPQDPREPEAGGRKLTVHTSCCCPRCWCPGNISIAISSHPFPLG